MYAQLCKRLKEALDTDEDKHKSSTFLRIIVNVCRDKFENRVQYSEKIINSENTITDDLEEKKNVAKQKMLGNVKFIGELYKLDMLAESYLHKMLQQLFLFSKSTSKHSPYTSENGEEMECLAQLIKTSGKNLDTKLGKQLMDQYFERMAQISQSTKFPPRIRFLLRDVIELRKNGWTPRKVARVEGPAPIQDMSDNSDILPRYNPRGRDYREREDQRDWISKFSLNLQNLGDGFSSLNVSSPTQLISSSYSPQNSYSNRDHRDGGGGNGGGGGNYRLHNNQRNNQNQHNNYNNNNMRYNKHNNHHGNTNSHNNSSYNTNNIMNNKDLAPRFKRNLMTTQGPVEDLQMRPTPNSLLFKANVNIKTQLPLTQLPPASTQNKINYNAPPLNDFISPLSAKSGSMSGSGGNSTNHNNYNQSTPNHQSSSYSTQTTSTSLPNQSNQLQNNKNTLNSMHQANSLNSKTHLHQQSLGGGGIGSTPINNILLKEQIVIKQASADKTNKQNKKDKGPNKEEYMKKVTVFINDILLENLRKQIEAEKLKKQEKVDDTKNEEENDETIINGDAVADENINENGNGKEEEIEEEQVSPEKVVVVVVDEQQQEQTEEEQENVEEKEKQTNGTTNTEENDAEKEEIIGGDKLMPELIADFYDLKVPDKFMKDSIIKMLNEVLDKSDAMLEKTIEFLHRMRKDNRLTNNMILESFKSVVNGMNEKEKTIPKITTIIASLLSRAVTVKLCKLSDVSNYTDNGQHYPLFLLVLQQLHKSLGKEKLQEMFTQSKVNLMTSLPECDRTKDRMAEILEDRNLSFLYPLLRVQAELWKQIQCDSNPQQFYKWIKENVDANCYTDPGFVTAVMTVLLKYITQESSKCAEEKLALEKESEILKKYCPVLNAFLNGNNDLQLIAIYSMQVHWYSIDFPKGVLLRWFRALYDLGIIEEDAFLRYKEDVTDMYPGKGKALFQVNQWLTWLAEAEDEDEEDEE